MPPLAAADPLLQTIPLWALAVLLVLIGALSVEIGVWWGRRQARPDGRKAPMSVIIASVLGLLALLIGLTFSLALDRHDERRVLAASEANAIRTAYLAADMFDEPVRTKVKTELYRYTEARIVPDGMRPSEVQQRKREQASAAAAFSRLRGLVQPYGDTDPGQQFLSRLDTILEVGNLRELASRAHVPGSILDGLFLYTFVSAAMLGWLLAKDGTSQRTASNLLVFQFVLGIVLIIDLDRPREGTILVSQEGLTSLLQSMRNNNLELLSAGRPG